jgi:hypothetical protein
MTNPAIVVPAGARISIDVINADPGTAHGLVITASTDTTSPMPMMTDRPAFTGSALWFLGNPTSAGMHAGTLTFTAAAPGTYQYLCPVPGHAQKGNGRRLHYQVSAPRAHLDATAWPGAWSTSPFQTRRADGCNAERGHHAGRLFTSAPGLTGRPGPAQRQHPDVHRLGRADLGLSPGQRRA